MRFLLDHDVDVDVRRRLRDSGHDCWTASDAGLFDARDDDLTAYACDRAACLVTHDREFSQRRRANAVGRHIWLVCKEWDASAVLLGAMGDIGCCGRPDWVCSRSHILAADATRWPCTYPVSTSKQISPNHLRTPIQGC